MMLLSEGLEMFVRVVIGSEIGSVTLLKAMPVGSHKKRGAANASRLQTPSADAPNRCERTAVESIRTISSPKGQHTN